MCVCVCVCVIRTRTDRLTAMKMSSVNHRPSLMLAVALYSFNSASLIEAGVSNGPAG